MNEELDDAFVEQLRLVGVKPYVLLEIDSYEEDTQGISVNFTYGGLTQGQAIGMLQGLLENYEEED